MAATRTSRPKGQSLLPRQWQDRLVRHAMTPIAEMTANPMNWRIHPGPQQELIAASLETLGWIRAVLVNENTGCIVDGHQRVLEADKAGQLEVPVDYVDLTPDEEAVALATFDAITAMAVVDVEKREELLAAIAEDREKAGQSGYANEPAIDAYLAGLRADLGEPGAPVGDDGGNGSSVYESGPTRQLVLHYPGDEWDWVLRILTWARDFYGVDTNTEAVSAMMREAWREAGEPELPEARRPEDGG